MQKTRTVRLFTKTLLILLCLALLCAAAVAGINLYVVGSTAQRILTPEEAAALSDVDCILVLGSKVRPNGDPGITLEDRLLQGISLYQLGASPKLLMSGDHGTSEYDEVNTMKQYAIDAGVPSRDVFMDHAGFSTYESIARTRDVFQADKVIIVTQQYHLYRSLYLADRLGVEAYGVAADYRALPGTMLHLRETLARCKDFVFAIVQPEPTWLGEAIPVSGNGDVTNDQ